MELIHNALELFLHLDKHLAQFTQDHGMWVYGILFAIIFCETGLVITPFLPGDSLLFAVGALGASKSLDPFIASLVILAAAILGDTVNYWMGRLAGQKIIRRFNRLIKPKHLEKTEKFYERYGGKAIILARFVPIVRTLAPFVAGLGLMNYGRFMRFNVWGAVLWVALLIPAGFIFGNIPIVKKNFELVVLAIIALSLLPLFTEWLKARRAARQTPK